MARNRRGSLRCIAGCVVRLVVGRGSVRWPPPRLPSRSVAWTLFTANMLRRPSEGSTETMTSLGTPASIAAPGNMRLALGALGVVFGDIGTSPLYAFRESFIGV